VIAYPYVAQHLGAGSNDHVVPDRGMALTALIARASERYVLVQENVVSDLSGFPDDHAHSVINEKAPADGGPGVDLNARHRAADL
jgi:hypothetical protein